MYRGYRQLPSLDPVTRRLKNEMRHQAQQDTTQQLAELTSLCQAHDVDNTGTLDKTLVRMYTTRNYTVQSVVQLTI